MKRIVILICAVWICVSSNAQEKRQQFSPTVFQLPITTVKTTSLIFPYAIKHIDRGTKDVLVQQVKEAENLLMVKAATADFKTTNLSVVTADGELYTFEVSYKNDPEWTVKSFTTNNNTGDFEISFPNELMNARELEFYAKGILDNPAVSHGMKKVNWEMVSRVKGIYIHKEVLFFQLLLENKSSIDYDIDFIRIYIKDKKIGKRTAAQQIELIPLYQTGNNKSIPANQENVLVFALPKFTIPDAKYCFIEIAEKNGGRHFQLRIRNSKIIRARILPNYN